MMRYKNPLFFKENDKFDLGDPFVFRYNGDYYLFHTSHVPPVGIRVYVSHDLIDWDYRGFAATDEKAIGGFAPEIIYAYNRFYMCTSPLGKGHYIFSSDKPEGPYKRITDNLESMIDGSFFVTSDAKLHFLRANHHGIATFDMDENGQISNRRNIDVEMGAWTEGPSLIYKDGYYYLFYCGNNYTAKGYRVNYAYSKSIDGPYITGPNEPLLINTDGRYTRLGHSSEVLSPDLLGYQMFYHSLDIHEDGKREGRRIHMDRLHFADGLVNVTPTDYSISSISLPTFEARIKDLPIVDGFALSSKKTSSHFVLEASFSSPMQLVLSHRSNQNYYKLNVKDACLQIVRITSKKEKIVASLPCAFDFSARHQVRIINLGDEAEILVDNAPLGKVAKFPSGHIGYLVSKTWVSDDYIAFTNAKNENPETIFDLPFSGLLAVKDAARISGRLSRENDIISRIMKAGDSALFRCVSGKGGSYSLSAYLEVVKDSIIRVNGQEIQLIKKKNEYRYNIVHLSSGLFPKKPEVSIEVSSGQIDFVALKIEPLKTFKNINLFADGNNARQDNYYLVGKDNYYQRVSCTFRVSEFIPYESFGILLNVRNYSSETNQCRNRLNGLLFGVTGKLLTIDEWKYRSTRIFDRGFNLKENTDYHLLIKRTNNYYEMYIDDQLVIRTHINTLINSGRVGFYASAKVDVIFNHFEFE